MNPEVDNETTTESLDLVSCPECHDIAEVEWRSVLESTDGPVEHLKIRCLCGHRFLMPAELLAPKGPP